MGVSEHCRTWLPALAPILPSSPGLCPGRALLGGLGNRHPAPPFPGLVPLLGAAGSQVMEEPQAPTPHTDLSAPPGVGIRSLAHCACPAQLLCPPAGGDGLAQGLCALPHPRGPELPSPGVWRAHRGPQPPCSRSLETAPKLVQLELPPLGQVGPRALEEPLPLPCLQPPEHPGSGLSRCTWPRAGVCACRGESCMCRALSGGSCSWHPGTNARLLKE